MKKIVCSLILLMVTNGILFAETGIVRDNNKFAFDLYATLREQEGNLFFSNYSISTALAMTFIGARRNTEKQMADVLHFTVGQEKLHPAFADLEAQLNVVQNKSNIELNIANSLWAQQDHVFLSDFLESIQKYYSTVMNYVNFKTNAELARLKINAWVQEKTKDKIKELIKPGILNNLTRLVLINAIYFKGTWESKFEKYLTKDDKFWISKDKSITAPLMYQRQSVKYMESDSLQMLELPYKGGEISMIILLPKKIDGLSELEAGLSVENFNTWMSSLRIETVLVYLPRFKTSSAFNLNGTLASMGMPDAFDLKLADFSGMDGITDSIFKLYISAVIHKAFVDVNEEGTEAAAATAVTMATGAMPLRNAPPVFVFRADHPFVFLIRHNPLGSILFLGRVTNPTQES